MAISPLAEYPAQVSTADPTGYPYGKPRNRASVGDSTGTPWEAKLVSDFFGFFQSLLSDAGATPSGTPDKVGASQYLDALKLKFVRKGANVLTSVLSFTGATVEFASLEADSATIAGLQVQSAFSCAGPAQFTDAVDCDAVTATSVSCSGQVSATSVNSSGNVTSSTGYIAGAKNITYTNSATTLNTNRVYYFHDHTGITATLPATTIDGTWIKIVNEDPDGTVILKKPDGTTTLYTVPVNSTTVPPGVTVMYIQEEDDWFLVPG
jgi:hypothetical protein